METQSEIRDYVRRPKRYENIDGTLEMYFGVMFLGFALVDYLQSMLPADSIWIGKNWHQLVFMPVLLTVLGIGWWGIKAVKRHITYPRTGYVVLNTNTWRVRLVVFIGASVSTALTFAVFYGLRRSASSLRHMTDLILYEAPYVGFVLVWRDHPWKWFVALFMALGLAALHDQSRSTMLFLGLTWLASGGITLYLYIRRTQPPAQAAE